MYSCTGQINKFRVKPLKYFHKAICAYLQEQYIAYYLSHFSFNRGPHVFVHKRIDSSVLLSLKFLTWGHIGLCNRDNALFIDATVLNILWGHMWLTYKSNAKSIAATV